MTTTAHAEATASATPASAPEPSFEDLARRVDDAMTAVARLDPSVRAVAEELKSALEAVHQAGLRTIVRRMQCEEPSRDVLHALVDDPVVRMLLALHGILRPDPITLANKVLVEVRPRLHSHGGDVTLVRIEDGVAYVRLEGACNGCSLSSVTLRNLVEGALVEGVSSITSVEVLPNEPSPTLIPLDSLRIGTNPREEGWVRACALDEVPAGEITLARLVSGTGEAVEAIVVNLEQRLSAYRNACAHQGLPLDNALLDPRDGTLTCPWHGFCFDASSGECLSAPGAQLEQLPLRVDDGHVWIRVGG